MPARRQLACKVPRDPRSFEQIKMLFAELKVLMYAGSHPHVIALIGACTEQMTEGVLVVALELAQHGSLKSNLTQCAHYIDLVDDEGRLNNARSTADPSDANCLDTHDLVAMAYQIADGMAYLASRSIVHRDLAARNVLVMARKIVKLADFGLARQCRSDYTTLEYTRCIGKDVQPFRWMPPECFTEQQHFTEQSDVWSFGVTLWEVFKLGRATPYDAITDVSQLFQGVGDGSLRLGRPSSAPLELFKNAMAACWQDSAESRPTFAQLSTTLAEMTANSRMADIEVHRSEHVAESIEAGSGQVQDSMLPRRTHYLAVLLVGASSIALLVAAVVFSTINGGALPSLDGPGTGD